MTRVARSRAEVHENRRRWTGDVRLLPSAGAAWCTAALGIGGEALTVTSAALVAAVAGLLLACIVFVAPPAPASRLLRGVSLAVAPAATVMLVLLTTAGSLARAEAGPVDEAARTGANLTVVLRVTGEPSSIGPGTFGGGDRYLVDADVIGGIVRSEAFASTTPVVVLGPEEWSTVGSGDVVRVLGTVQPPNRPGKARGMFIPGSGPVIEQATGWLGYTDDIRARFRAVSQEDRRDGGLLPGMALGDRVPLDPLLEEDMKATGLTHLTAVSGANCSYVVAFTFLGLRLLRCPRVVASVGAVVALAAFVLLVRPEPSVLRAAVMGAIGVAAVLSGRGKVSLTLLMLSVIVLLAVDPWLSVSFAFMLSVAATLGLVLAGPLVARVLTRVLPRVLAQLVAIPLTAQLFCTPILVLIQPALPVYSLPANVLASPVVPVVTLLGMSAVLALVGAPVIAVPLVSVAQWGTRWVAGVAGFFADAPGVALPWPSGAVGASLAALLSLALVAVLVRCDALEAPAEGRSIVTRVQLAVDAFGSRASELARTKERHRGGGSSAAMTGTTRNSTTRNSTTRNSAIRNEGTRVEGTSNRGSGIGGTGNARIWTGGNERGRSGPNGIDAGQRSARPGIGASGPRDPAEVRTRRRWAVASFSRTGVLVCTALLAILVLTGALLLHRTTVRPAAPWIVAMCDVGQGDGIVVNTTPGHALVVDAGPDPDAMDRCLDSLGIRVIDALVITHLHEDHYGGVGGTVEGREVRAFYYSSGEDRLPREVVDAAGTAHVDTQRLTSESVLDLPPIDIDVLWPMPRAPGGEENNASAVLRVVVPAADRPVTLLLTGDLEDDAAVGLLSSEPALADGVDILKIAHHGARNGGRTMIDAVHPSLAVISVGEGNDYGHPHPSILDALQGSGVATARTDELGSFTVGIAGDRVEVRPFP